MHKPKTVAELVEEQFARSQSAAASRAGASLQAGGLVVTISRAMGTGARLIAEQLARDLGWSIWGKELIDAVAQAARVSPQVAEMFDEKYVSQVERIFQAAFTDVDASGFVYQQHLARTVAAIARFGHAVVVGRGVNFLLPEALSVRLDATLEHRVANMVRFENMTPAAAVAKLKDSDRERQQYLFRMFGRKHVEARGFDVHLSMDRLHVAATVEILKAAIAAWSGPQAPRG